MKQHAKNFYRKEARGRDCQIRIEGVCNFNPETTVLAHLNGSGGGMKAKDLHGAWSCSKYRSCVDGAVKTKYSKDERDLFLLQGVIRTQIALISEGKL